MPKIEIKGLFKGFGDNKVLKDVNITVEDGEYVIVLGPSGCGKTTLLKVIAGLYQPDDGHVIVDGVDVTETPAEERGFGFFFQHYSLFPHMTVRQNVGYSLSVRGVKESEVRQVVEEKLTLVGLLEWADRMPYELSGGMQQRVALARVLATGSKLLLLDEPLNALDAKIAAILRCELKEMAKSLGLTVIHVTPNQAEAMELADRMVLFNHGRIVQAATDVDSYLKPKTLFAAYFIGESNFLKVSRVGPRVAKYRHAIFNVGQDIPEDEVILAIRPEKVLFEDHERNTLDGVLESVSFLGHTTRYEVSRKGRIILVETSKHPSLRAGDCVHVYFPPEDLMVFPTSQPIDDEITVI